MSELQEFRQQKDIFFKTSARSPLQDDDFSALTYFPEAPQYVFDVPFERIEGREVLELQTSTGDTIMFVRYARTSFELEGEAQALTLFSQIYEDEPERFFVPFKDATSGEETYSAGRYLDALRAPAGRVLLDFNYAYNPYCAYSQDYRCPLPPAENHLSAAIRAGEKTYHS